ncbi:MAG: hypothetical protein KDJ77_11120 [Rhodobiaceae bacterium]|nr:hypothetical protein [Rhodobiaceae bacterium]
MSLPSDVEQLTLELINRMRMDPTGEFDRLIASISPPTAVQSNITSAMNFFGVDLNVLQAQLASLTAVAPLAWNSNLENAATDHSQLMIDNDDQQHQFSGELELSGRVQLAGYTGWSALGENIYAYSDDPLYGHAGFVIDWGYDDNTDFDANNELKSNWQTLGDGIQDGAGHRVNIMNADFTEVGIGIIQETNSSTEVGEYVTTQDFGSRFSYQPQLLGVVINDIDNDDFYDIGEGMGGVTVSISDGTNTYQTTTWSSGGWQIEVPQGSYTITYSGGGLSADIVRLATLNNINVKVDVEAADAGTGFPTTGNDIVYGDTSNNLIDLLAGNDIFFGYGGWDTIIGGPGADTIDGGDGNDTASYSGSTVGVNVQLQYGITSGGDAAGDTLISIESLTGSNKNDILIGDANANTIRGANGNDFIKGLNGADKLFGDLGDDWLYADSLDTSVLGGGGIDRLIVVGSGGVTNAVGTTGIEIAVGNVGNDTFDGTGASADLTLSGLGGNDILTGGDGDDYLYGGSGADQLRGGAGLDRLFVDEADTVIDGGSGSEDRVIVQQLASASSGVTLNMAASNVEVAYGNLNDDTFNGSSSTDALSLYGRNGQDVLTGGSANDRLFGDNNDSATGDILNGGGGNDYLHGGANTSGWAERDQFVFDADWGNDRIFDFANNGAEKIDFSSIAGITQLSDLTITNGAGYAMISYTDGGGWSASIRVDGTTLGDFTNVDFIFV